jgi:hypothetical protein
MEKKYIVQHNYKPDSSKSFEDYADAIMAAIKCDSATISDATTGAILYVTYTYGDTRIYITTINGEVRIKEANN